MTSNINPDRPESMRDLDGSRENFRAAKDEIEALQGGEGGGGAVQSHGFWFANLSADVPSGGAWFPMTTQGGGMTGDQTLATVIAGSGLRLEVLAIVQLKLWVEFETPGTGADQVAIQLDQSAYNGPGAVTQRGQQQLLDGATMVQAVYDGWLSPGALISTVALSEAGNTVKPNSYATIVITPTGS